MKSIFTILSLLITTMLFSQTTLFQENFEGSTISFTSSSTGSGAWALNTRLQAQGLKSDSAVVTTGDTTYLTSNSFSTLNKFSVYLSFSQIAKVDFFDGCEIQVSNNGGTSWTKLLANQYMGTGQFQNGRFSAVSYPTLWQANTAAAVPQNTWWKHETFDISALVGNAANVKIRFAIIDLNNNGAGGNAGWFIDSVLVVGSYSELIPPSITLVSPVLGATSGVDTVYGSGPFNITAQITDNTGIDTAVVIYQTSTGVYDTLGMDSIAPDTFQASIPFFGFGRSITYYVKAVDASPAHNMDSTASRSFFCKYSAGGDVIIGTGTTTNQHLPMEMYYGYTYSQSIFKASYFGGTFGSITKVAYYYNGTGAYTDAIKIYMGTTSLTSFASTSSWIPLSNLTLVYDGNITTTTTPGWIELTLQTPFTYGGGSNLVIAFDENTPGYHSSTNDFYCSLLDNDASSIYFYNDVTNPDPASPPTSGYSLATSTYNPNVKITFVSASNLTNDIGVNQITNPTGGVTAGSPMPVKVTIKNFGVDTVTYAKVRWKYDGVVQSPLYTFNDSLKADSVSSVITLATINPTVGAHSITAWTEDPDSVADFNFANDSSSINFFACSSLLNGTYTINPSGSGSSNYASFSDAVLALSQCGISGPVTFNVANGTYIEHINIPPVNGSSATNTITFQSASGDSSLVTLKYNATGAANNYVVKLDGTSYIKFKGIHFQATDSTYARVFDLTNGVHDLSLENNIIEAQVRSYADNDKMIPVCGLDSMGSNVSVQNNVITNGTNAIDLLASTGATNWQIKNNIIHGHYTKGIHIKNGMSPNIIGNDIAQDSAFSASIYYGIYLEDNSGTPIIKMNKILSKISQIAFGIRMNNCAFSATNRGQIVNNFFNVHANSTSTTTTTGILVYNTPNLDIFYNNILVSGAQTNSAAIYLYGPNTDSTILYNNNFANSAGGYAFYTVNVTAADFTNNYNNLFTFGGTRFAKVTTTVCADLAAFQTATAEATNSISYNPYYMGADDLHIANNIMNGTGTPITGITTDIDGDLRNTTTPDIGADEFDPSPWDAAVLTYNTPFDSCGLDSFTVVSIKIKNLGSGTINGNFTASYTWPGKTSVVTENITTTMYTGDTLDYVFTTPANLDMSTYGADSTFAFTAWVSLQGDPVHFNDTTHWDVNSMYQPPAPVTQNVSVNYGGTATLTATSNDSLSWWQYDTSSTPLAKSNTYTTYQLWDTTTFWVSAGGGLGATQSLNVGTQSYVYSATQTRGYHFQAPIDFTITELMVPTSVTGAQNIQVVKFTGPPAAYGGTGTPFTTLFYASGVNTTVPIPVNIEIHSGDYIGILGARGTGTMNNSYGSSMTTTIGSSSMYISRLILQSSLSSGQAPSGQLFSNGTGNIGRVEMTYAEGIGGNCESQRVPLTVNVINFPAVDAGIHNITNPSSSIVSGTAHDIKVALTNYGTGTMTSANIKWWINGQMQDSLAWTGSLSNGAIDTVTLDTAHTFAGGMYNITAWTSFPNNAFDSIQSNDTASINFNACLQGTYTIGDTATGTFDFPNFTAALNAIQAAGLCGNVVFNVDTGTYYEQLTIPNILSSGPNATVTFQSANGDSTGVILKYAPTSSASNYVLKLNGCDYFTFKNMTIKNAGSGTYLGVVEIAGGSKHNSLLNNIIQTGVSTSSYARCIYSANGNDDYTRIENNHLINGYYGIYMRGAGSGSKEKGCVIKNNFIDGFYYYGIMYYYSDSVEISHNHIVDGATSSYGYGMYLYYAGNGPHVIGNILNLSPINYKYGIQIYYGSGTANNRGLIANNMISITSGTGSMYGMYFYNPTLLDIYYNSVNITSGSSSSRAIYISAPSTAADINIVNNNLRDSVGYTIYAGNYTGINNIDYNNYFTASSSNFAYWGGAKNSLSALQTASSKDVHSINMDPQFFNNDDLHMLSTQLSGMGTPLTEVPVDIDGEQRNSLATTIGADEVPLLPFDIGVSQILNMPDTTNEAQSYPVIVEIKNYGTDTVNAFTIEYTVNNGTPVSYSYTTPFAPGTIDTVTLTPMSSPAGNSTICATTVLAIDSNTFNDGTCHNFFGIPTKDAAVTQIFGLDEGCGLGMDTVKIWILNMGIDTINAAGQTNPTTVKYSSNGGVTVTETMSTVIAPGDSASYTFTNLVYLGTNNTVDSIYDIAAWIDFVGDNVSYNDTAYKQIESLHTPPDPTVVSPVNVPYGSPGTATANSNDSLYWYATATSTTEIGTGSTYTTPGWLYANDTVYVEAKGGASGGVNIIGTGTSNQYQVPCNGWYNYSWSSIIYDAADIPNAGQIDSISFHLAQNVSSFTMINQQIYMRHVPYSTQPNTSYPGTTGKTQVFNGTIVWNGQGWFTIVLDVPFVYNGVDNLEIYWENHDGSYTSGYPRFTSTSISGKVIHKYQDSSFPNISGYNSSYRPNLKFWATPTGCPSNRIPVIFAVGNQPPNDVGVVSIDEPISAINLSSTENVKITVKNFGSATQDTIPVAYQIGNLPPVIDTVFASIATGTTHQFSFATKANLSISGNTYAIKAYTGLTTDVNHLNDTIQKTVTNQLPNYCACHANSGSYEDLTGVSVGTWSHTNAATGAMYTDYTSVSPTAVIAPGVSYPVTISSGFPPGYSYAYTCYTNMFIDFNRDGDFTDPGELVYGSSTNSNNTVSGTISVPATALPGLTRMRVVLRESGNSSNTGPCGTFTWGEAEDYNIMVMTPIPHDAGVEAILNPPSLNGTSVVPVQARIRNYGTDTIFSVDISYELNSGSPVTTTYNTAPIAPMDFVDVSLGNVTLQSGANTICAYTTLAGDVNTFNDQQCKNAFREAVVNLTYFDDFEGSDLWMPDTLLNQWQRGVPAMTNINTAHSPVNVWAVDLDSTYANNSADYLYTPRMITTGLDSAMLKFWHYYVTQSGSDGGAVQVSVNNGNWTNLGYIGDPLGTNWYTTNIGGTHFWTGNSNGWIQSTYKIKFNVFPFAGADTIQFRFFFKSNGSSNNYDGWAIDDFTLELPKIQYDAGVVAITNPGTSTQVGSSVNVDVKVKNFGWDTLTSIPVHYKVGSTVENATITISGGLLPDSVYSYSFTTPFTSPSADYKLCAYTTLSGDLYPQNDTACKQLTVTAPPVDIEMVSLEVSPSWHDTTKMTFNTALQVTMVSHGTNPVTSIPVEYRINSNVIASETWTGTANQGDTIHFSLTTTYKGQLGVYAVCAKAKATGDAVSTNDEYCRNYLGINNIGFDENSGLAFSVEQNQPNPAHGIVHINYVLPKAGKLHFELRNVLGQVVKSEELEMPVGANTYEIDANQLSGGVYYYTFEFEGTRITKKMVVNN